MSDRMTIKWVNEAYARETIARIARQTVSVTEDEWKMSSMGIPFTLVPILCDLLILPEKVSRVDYQEMVEAGIKDAARRGELNLETFRASFNKILNAYTPGRKYTFCLCTSINVPRSAGELKYKVPHATVSILPHAPPHFTRKAIFTRIRDIKEPIEYAFAAIQVRGRSFFEAGEKALEAFTLLRGIWNLYDTFQNSRTTFGYRYKGPINSFVIGPIHTLHKLDGRLAFEDYWFERHPSPYPSTKQFPKSQQFEKFYAAALAKVSRGDDAPILRRLVMWYCRIQDERILSNSFLGFWGLLEQLTDTSDSRRDLTIERVAATVRHPRTVKAELGFLNKLRNRIVHSGFSTEEDDAERYTYLLKTYVDHMLYFHLFGILNLRLPFKERCEALSHATSIEEISSKEKLLRAARLVVTRRDSSEKQKRTAEVDGV